MIKRTNHGFEVIDEKGALIATYRLEGQAISRNNLEKLPLEPKKRGRPKKEVKNANQEL